MRKYNTAVPPVECGNSLMIFRYFSKNQVQFSFFRLVVAQRKGTISLDVNSTTASPALVQMVAM